MSQNILFVGAEIMPFAATGGLGDVMGSLPAALAAKREGEEDYPIRCVMPLYDAIKDDWRRKMTKEAEFNVPLAWRNQYCGVWSLIKDGVKYYFLDNEYYFKRGQLYGHYDDGERYAYFCMAVIRMMEELNWYPDVLHANDWQSALTVIYLRTICYCRQFRRIKTIFTIHNIAFQGKYGFEILGDVFALSENVRAVVEYDGCINLMKGAIVCADRVTTVSPRYAKEICDPAYAQGLEEIIRTNSSKVSGILNGIDTVFYDPSSDECIPYHYSVNDIQGKKRCRTAFRKKVNLPDEEDVPLIVMISRLTSQKGLDILAPVLDGLVCEKNVQFAVLGKGDEQYEEFFRSLEKKYPERVRALIAYDRALSKELYAAGDIFLMPSRTEPCGLAQMIACRYGTIPVVRETGGLADSIQPFHIKDGKLVGCGVSFMNYDPSDLYFAVTRALEITDDKKLHTEAVRLMMNTDFSWDRSAESYESLYFGL